jgi:hypothetical protein
MSLQYEIGTGLFPVMRTRTMSLSAIGVHGAENGTEGGLHDYCLGVVSTES